MLGIFHWIFVPPDSCVDIFLLRSQSSAFSVNPSDMAKVGAAALACGVTHKLSMPIVLLEMTGDFNILFPSMVPFT